MDGWIVVDPIVRAKLGYAAGLVLPGNYGWGMRNPQDNIWGLWEMDNRSGQIWGSLQKALATYGFQLDIVYEDSAFPVFSKYSRLFYWNQTS
jgi:hypothetical protein